jgi:hypothetical protein
MTVVETMRVALMNPARGKRRTRGKKTKGRKHKGKKLTPYQQHMKTQIKTKGKTFKQAVSAWNTKHPKRAKVHKTKAHKVRSRRPKAHRVKARRTHKIRKAGKVTAKFTGTLKTNPRRHKARRHVKRHKNAMANPRRHRRKARHAKKVMSAMANPRRHKRSKAKRHRKRRNPEYPTIGGGFLPTFARIKANLMPHRPHFSDFIPTWAEIKAHPIYMAGGFIIGGVSSAMWGGLGRLAGGKNVLLGEVLALGGNILGFEVPARFIGMFNFKAKNHMVKGVRLGGIIVTIFSLIMGAIRIFKAVKGKGLKGLGATNKPNLGALVDFPKISEIPKKIVNTLGLGTIGTGNPLADAVSSGTQTGYFKYEPMGVSGAPGYNGTEYIGDPNKESGNYTDIYMGDLGGKIKELKEVLGLSDTDIAARAAMLGSQSRADEMPGVGQVVPPMYSGGPSRDFIV